MHLTLQSTLGYHLRTLFAGQLKPNKRHVACRAGIGVITAQGTEDGGICRLILPLQRWKIGHCQGVPLRATNYLGAASSWGTEPRMCCRSSSSQSNTSSRCRQWSPQHGHRSTDLSSGRCAVKLGLGQEPSKLSNQRSIPQEQCQKAHLHSGNPLRLRLPAACLG